MSEIFQLPQELQDKLDEILTKAGEVARGGDIKTAAELGISAWELIPEPKEQWSFYPQIITINTANDFAELKDAVNFKKWIELAHKMYHDPQKAEHYVLMTEGEGYLKMDMREEAYHAFKKIFDLYGRKGFAGEQIEYYKFMMAYKGSVDE